MWCDVPVARPTANLLDLLELLQSRTTVSGEEIATRLGVDRRTVRRYVAALQDLGIPVQGERGAGGGYRLRSGFRLPPLMLGEREATAVVLGLAAARRLGLGHEADVDAALAKLLRVLPDDLARRAAALDAALGFTYRPETVVAAPADHLLALADAVRRGRRVAFAYRTFAGDEGRREASPYGIVSHQGRWYLAALDHGRDEPRTFRVDRIAGPELMRDAATAPPEGFDPAEHVARSLARVPWRWEVEVLLRLPLDDARRRLPVTLAELEPEGQGTRLAMRVDSLDWMASVLAGLGCGFDVRRPDELRVSVRELATRLAEQVT